MQEQLMLTIDSVDQVVQEPVEEVIPELVQVLLYHQLLMTVYEVHLFNSINTLPLFELDKWHAILTPSDGGDRVIVRCDNAKSFEDVMLHCSLLSTRLVMKGPVTVNPIYITSKYEEGMIVTGRDSKGDNLSMAVEFVNNVLKFNVIQ